MERLADLDELVLRCRTDRAREYISEAVSCYRAGAYRASIVTTWIAVVYDLIDKVRSLKEDGDNQARDFITSFENIQESIQNGDPDGLKNSLAFERDILKSVMDKFEFLSMSEFSDLARLKDDRNRCAHPTVNKGDEVYRPSAELARLHLRNAIAHVLQQPPRQGRASLKIVVSDLDSAYFPKTVEGAVTRLKGGPLYRAKDSLVRDFIKEIFVYFFGQSTTHEGFRTRLAALQAVAKMYPELAVTETKKLIDSWVRKIGDDKLPIAFWLLGSLSEYWETLDANVKSKLLDYIRAGSVPAASVAATYAPTLPEVRQEIDTLVATMDFTSLSSIVPVYQSKAVIERSLGFLAASGSFVSSNNIFDRILIPCVLQLDASLVRNLVYVARQNEEVSGAFRFYRSLITAIKNGVVSKQTVNDILREFQFPEITDEDLQE